MFQILQFAVKTYFGLAVVVCGVPNDDLPSLANPMEPTSYVCTIRINDAQFVTRGEFFQIELPEPELENSGGV